MSESTESDPGAAGGINGETTALEIDRAVGELRRGRAIHIVRRSGGRAAGFIAAAVEAAQAPLLRRLEAAGGREIVLLLTAERARAAELARGAKGPVAITLAGGLHPEALRALASVSPVEPGSPGFLRVDEQPPYADLAAAGFQLAKAGRLLPALVGIATDERDPSMLRIAVDDVQSHARFATHSLKRMSQSRVPLADAVECELALFRDEHRLGEHVAVLIGEPDLGGVVPVRLHSACLTGDLLGSLRCDCGEQLRTAVRRIAALGGGVLLYLDQEGRGIGLANKLRAYALQDNGFDTIDADRHLGFLSDERNYDVAAALLNELGVARVQLLTNNPQKIDALRAHGIDVVGRQPLIGKQNSHNERYLKAKRDRAGHHLAEEPEA